MLALIALKIMVGCLCRGPSRRFQGAGGLGTHEKKKKLAQLLIRLFGPCFKTGPTRPKKKKRVHVIWSSQAVLEMAALGAHAHARPSICE